mgnify:CR=1 FL=1|tara:strand:- start:362 stop:1153 length:792 start_codon:yes stop_codon:yes gene_type:complete
MLGFWKVEKKVAEKFKSVTIALVLADFVGKEAVLKKGKKLLKGGWFYYNVQDIEKNLMIGRTLRRKSVKALIEDSFILIKKHSTALNRTHYKIDHKRMKEFLQAVDSSPHEVDDTPASEVNNAPASEVAEDPTYKKNIIRIDNKKDIINNILGPVQIMDLWNELAKGDNGFSIVRKLSAARIKKVKARLKDVPTLEEWNCYLDIIQKSDFLSGRSKVDFVASFDWIIEEKNFLKIVEGNYNRNGNRPQNDGNRSVVEEYLNSL